MFKMQVTISQSLLIYKDYADDQVGKPAVNGPGSSTASVINSLAWVIQYLWVENTSVQPYRDVASYTWYLKGFVRILERTET